MKKGSGNMIRVSAKGQIVLPKILRDKMDIREGDYLFIQEIEAGLLLIEKPEESPLQTIASALREEAKSKGFTREDLQKAIREAREANRE